jgi:hypothetical protein
VTPALTPGQRESLSCDSDHRMRVRPLQAEVLAGG